MKRDKVDVDQMKVTDADPAARMLVHAGPGTGKTEVSAQRLARLVHAGIRPAAILVLSFSRSAVRTLASRLEKPETGTADVMEELRHLTIRTFDAWAFRMLRQLGVPPSALLAGSYEQNIQQLAESIKGEDREAVRGLLEGIRHVIIDEFQDLPGVRGRLVLALLELVAPPGSSGVGFTVLGDPAQGIYEFASRNGEDASATSRDSWAELRRVYGPSLAEITLRTNYRASASLATATEELREVITGELDSEGKLARLRAYVSALPAATAPLSPEWLACVPPGRVAILTRTNGQAVRVAKALLGTAAEGPPIPVSLQLAGQVAPVPGWIAALLSPLRAETLLRSKFGQIHAAWLAKAGEATAQALGLPEAETAWQRIVRAAGLPVSTTSLPMEELRQRLDWPDAFPDDQSPGDARIFITTIHQAKGMEFDSVCLLGRREDEEEEDAASALEEASVCFVGITRARTNLGVIPGDHIYQAPGRKEFRGRRSRLFSWRAGWVNMEMGLAGDIDALGFVDEGVLGSAEEVAGVQQQLMSQATGLGGHKVMLCKTRMSEDSPKAVYDIYLQEGNVPGCRLGRMSQQLTLDLLDVLHRKGYSLPSKIMNLRISSVVTLAGPVEVPPSIAEPYRSSRLWLGVTVSGTGDFKPFRAGSKK
jgi:DNA helicase-2/ATP-dependent DNA helicase PcrA